MARMKFLCDAERCIECNGCVTACKNENEVPWGVNRRRVVTLNDGEPGEKSISVACMHCTDAPCSAVCPVDCFYTTDDGIVLHDKDLCIGCGYCVMACPYGVRFFHPVHKVADKCNFCYHRITKGMDPACVQSCPFGARRIANLRDPDDPVTKLIKTERVSVLKDEYGTKPHVFYLGLDANVR